MEMFVEDSSNQKKKKTVEIVALLLSRTDFLHDLFILKHLHRVSNRVLHECAGGCVSSPVNTNGCPIADNVAFQVKNKKLWLT